MAARRTAASLLLLLGGAAAHAPAARSAATRAAPRPNATVQLQALPLGASGAPPPHLAALAATPAAEAAPTPAPTPALARAARSLLSSMPPEYSGESYRRSRRLATPTRLVPAMWASATPGSLSITRLDQFLSTLTTVVAYDNENRGVRAVHSSGGAAGGVVSEGQGYGLFLCAATLAALPSGHSRRADLVIKSYELFLGWRRMCQRTDANSCQSSTLCSDSNECLPSWKFDDNLDSEVGTGRCHDSCRDRPLCPTRSHHLPNYPSEMLFLLKKIQLFLVVRLTAMWTPS